MLTSAVRFVANCSDQPPPASAVMVGRDLLQLDNRPLTLTCIAAQEIAELLPLTHFMRLIRGIV